MSIRIALVDPHAQYRHHLAELLARRAGAVVVFEAADVQAAMRRMNAGTAVDVLLLDIDLPAGMGLRALRCLARRHPRTRLVALSLHDEPAVARAAVAAGARACALKQGPLDALLATLA